MYKFKKLISALAIAAVTATMFTSASFAAIPSDAVGTDVETQATVLGGLEIMVGDAGTGTFRPGDPIIRSEVAKVGVALMGLSQVADSSSDVSFYPDVDASHWANGFINVATAQKLVIGDDTGTFRPDDQIKYSEAVAILVRALGYEPQVKNKGGYPAGYISVASSIGLTKGVSGSSDKLISRGDVAKLAYNALDIKLMEQVGFGSNIDYHITDKTLLEEKLDTLLVTGKVEAVGSSTLDGSEGVDRGEIKISGKVYKTGKADVRNLLGFAVDAYVSNQKGKTRSLVAVVPTEGENRVLSVAADDIDSIEKGSSSVTLRYFEDADTHKKSAKATILADAHIIYNGMGASPDKLTVIPSGSVILLDSDNDKTYDVVFVNETQNYVVDEIFDKSQKITDKYNLPALELDTDDDKKTVIIEMDNKAVGVEDLKEWDVITVTKSEKEDLVYGIVTRNSVTGKIGEKDKSHVYVDGKKLKVSTNYTEGLSLGDKGTFYLDFEGKIAAFDSESSKSSNYAYLIKAAMSGNMDKELKLKVFTKDGKIEVLTGASKISVNSASSVSASEALGKIGEGEMLITFETNSKGEVSKINTSKSSQSIDENSFVMNLEEKDVVYRAASSKLVASDISITVGADTLIFELPESGTQSDWAVRSKSVFADGGLYDVKVYDVSENYKAGVIIITNSVSKIDDASALAVIKSVTTTKDDDGETVHKVYVLSEGKEITLMSKDDKIFIKEDGSMVKEGDVIQYRTSVSGKVDSVKVIFEAHEIDGEFKEKVSDDLTFIYGKITKKFSDSVNVSVSGGKTENYGFDEISVYVYDSGLRKDKVSLGDKSDIQTYENDGSRVLLKVYKDIVSEIVVIK